MTIPRQSETSTTYHVFNRGNNKQQIFFDEEDYSVYKILLAKYIKRFEFSLLFYCLMPNHIHLCLRQNGDAGLDKLIQAIHLVFARYSHKKYGTVGHIFQGRYKNKPVLTTYYLLYLSVYIHLNPYKITGDVFEYPHSSLKEYIGNSPALCDQRELMEHFFDRNDYQIFIENFLRVKSSLFDDENMLSETDCVRKNVLEL